jgi:hypothetical protein
MLPRSINGVYKSMRLLLRKIVIHAAIAIFAVTGGFAPQTVWAAAGHYLGAQETVAHHHDHVLSGEAAVPCLHEQQLDSDLAFPDHNCCVASCSANAFIISSFNFVGGSIAQIFDVPLALPLTPVASITLDPPPR